MSEVNLVGIKIQFFFNLVFDMWATMAEFEIENRGFFILRCISNVGQMEIWHVENLNVYFMI